MSERGLELTTEGYRRRVASKGSAARYVHRGRERERDERQRYDRARDWEVQKLEAKGEGSGALQEICSEHGEQRVLHSAWRVFNVFNDADRAGALVGHRQ